MRILPILSAVLLTAASPAFAQVTLDLHALQALPEHPESRHTDRPAHAAAQKPAAMATRETPGEQTAMPTRVPATQPPGQPPAQQPAMPQTVPATATINPIAPPPPPAGTAPPPPPVVSDKAATTAAPTTAGLRLTFAPGESELNPASSASIKELASATRLGDETTFNVLAYSPGKADDPSTARRVSLSRAMAVRGALVADGVPSARIFVRAMGEQFGDGPPDRVDLSVTGAATNTATSK